ncbi:MAG: UDP-glucose/GDP-mannose dehydrogenase family protein [Acidobacteria bacterium]|nr:UDP-glucose/GDP-mannose dehydrogenase family protein [Acidobacteriota bacterium]MBI3658057.1 UDP-glucose/GDP-mannose dehydrogenase family protein [Acidobacteriota bacterium]
MRICMMGAGYVGLVTGACFAESGNDVICVDIDTERIAMLKRGKMPIYEPGLAELVQRNVEEGRLEFTSDADKAIKRSLVIYIAVGTPPREDGSADLRGVLEVAKGIGEAMDSYKIVVTKSTVPVGTADKIHKILGQTTKFQFDVVSNPEFLKEGAAIDDFMKPDRVVIGTDDVRVAEIMKELYSPFCRTGAPILLMDPRSAEMTKYAANSMLATRISFMNEIANLCDRLNVNIDMVRQGMGTDSRIGSSFLFPGIGYGGSCFPKDIRALVELGRKYEYPLRILKCVDDVNRDQKEVLYQKVNQYYGGKLRGKTFAVWGLSFKPRTDDMREAPSITVINHLLKKGAKVKAHDPQANGAAERVFGKRIKYAATSYDALAGADALLIITEWNQFREPDFDKMKELMKAPVIFDGRNIFNPKKMRAGGFEYLSIGRP